MRWTLMDRPTGVTGKVWLKCECGTEKVVNKYNFTQGKTLSCGCLSFESKQSRSKDILIPVGAKYGRLTYLGASPCNSKGSRGIFSCECGVKKSIILVQVTGKNASLSCGCTVTHGMSHTRPYSIWEGIIQRCTNTNSSSYKNYGGRGVTVCDRWYNFNNFWEDIKGIYSDELTIDRIDNNKGYFLENVRFVDRHTQAINKRTIRGASGTKGVSMRNNAWRVEFKYGEGKRYSKQAFDCKLEATIHYHQTYYELTGAYPYYSNMD
jgi:hypothetical protein